MVYILTCPKHDIKLFKFIYTNLNKNKMQYLINIVQFSNNKLGIVLNSDIKDNEIEVKDYEDNGYYEIRKEKVKILKTFLVKIQAEFIMKDNSPFYQYGGFREINRLAYAYSVLVMKYYDSNTLSDDNVIYSICDIGKTNFDMYSYHTFDENKKIVYNNSSLLYEVECSLNYKEIFKQYL